MEFLQLLFLTQKMAVADNVTLLMDKELLTQMVNILICSKILCCVNFNFNVDVCSGSIQNCDRAGSKNQWVHQVFAVNIYENSSKPEQN